MDKEFHKKPIQLELSSLTTTTSKLPKDYELQGKAMTQICVYLVMAHNILQELVVNIDQIRIHTIPKGGVRTWETKGSQHVKVHGMQDKC
jgi:hypothetical protein